MVEGWDHPNSDLDLYVVSATSRHATPTGVRLLPLPTPEVDLVVHYEGSRRWDVESWRAEQVEQLLAKLEDLDDPEAVSTFALAYRETEILYRLSVAQPLLGDDWVADVRARIAESRLSWFLTVNAFNAADDLIDDSVGTLQSGDYVSSVLAAQKAFALTIDGLLYSKGHLSPNQKWRARKFADLQPAEISWDDYWAIETFADFSSSEPRLWVEAVLRRCEHIMSEVAL